MDINQDNMDKFIETVTKYHDYNLIKEDDMVCHIYSDGEVTLQKSGRLYKQRTEHVIEYGFNKKLCPDLFPIKTPDNNFGYVITKIEHSKEIRQLIENLLNN